MAGSTYNPISSKSPLHLVSSKLQRRGIPNPIINHVSTRGSQTAKQADQHQSKRPRLLIIGNPSPAHLYSLIPFLESLLSLLATLARLEDLAALPVDLFEVVKLFPYTRR